jgi:hypothetical protein
MKIFMPAAFPAEALPAAALPGAALEVPVLHADRRSPAVMNMAMALDDRRRR